MTKTFSVTNFKGAREITLSPSGSLVVIAGANGAGKSSFIDAFVELFDPRGVRLTPKPIHEGADEARAEYTDTALGIRLVRTWKKDDAGKLEAFALDGAKYSRPTDFVADLTGGLIFDPVAFLNLDEKKQRDALLAKVDLPIDLEEVAREKAGAESRRLEAGRDIKRLRGALAEMPNPVGGPTEQVSAQGILDEIQAAQNANRSRENAAREHQDSTKLVQNLEAEIARLADELGTARVANERTYKRLSEMPEPVDIAPLQTKLSMVDATNTMVRAKLAYARVADEHAEAETAQRQAQADLDAIENKKREALAAATFPVDGLSVDDTGITFEGVPFIQVNSAARRKVAFAIATAGDPKLKLVIIKDGDLLDGESLSAITDLATERGYTVLVERDRDLSRQIGFTIADGVLAEAVS